MTGERDRDPLQLFPLEKIISGLDPSTGWSEFFLVCYIFFFSIRD